MALDTYANLKTAIAEYAWRTGDTAFEARVPDFIALAEERLKRDVRTREMEATATLTLTNGEGALPTDYMAFRRIYANTSPRCALDLVSPDFALSQFPSDISGTPDFCTIIGNKLKVYPISTATVDLLYYQKIPSLSDSNTSNWLLTKSPSAYLYASLLEAMPYTLDDQRAGVWKTYYDTAIAGMKTDDIKSRFARFGTRLRGVTP